MNVVIVNKSIFNSIYYTCFHWTTKYISEWNITLNSIQLIFVHNILIIEFCYDDSKCHIHIGYVNNDA